MTTPDFTPYADEIIKMGEVLNKLSKAFDFSSFSETNKAILDIAAHEEFAKIGIEVAVDWREIWKNGIPTGVWLPSIEPIGRTRPESERDYDRDRFGVVKGLADGQPGYIRADGSRHEEPRKKDIF